MAAAIASGIKIDKEYDDESPAEFGEDLIRFNGRGDLGHETFWLARKQDGPCYDDGGHFAFCKTAQKPYDAVVCACLIALKHHFGDAIRVSSDGDNDGWSPGRKLLLRAGIQYGQDFKLDRG